MSRQVARHPARRTTVPTEAGPLAVLVAGESVRRRAVLMVPGFTGSKEDFAPLLGPLSADGRVVVAMDQRGQHESSQPEHPEPYAMAALAGDVGRVADHLELTRPHLLGHSFGGLVARAALLSDPGRFASLTLLGSGPSALGGPRQERIALLAPALDASGLAGVFDVLEAIAPLDPHYVEPSAELRAFLRHRWLAQSETGLREMGRALVEEPDRVAELTATGVPVLVAHGSRDDAWAPEIQRDMAERLGARYRDIPDAFHSPAVENPQATIGVLTEFWDSVDLTDA